MNRSTRSALITLLGSLAALLAATAWGTYFGFPEPGASAEESAQLQFHARVSGWLMLLSSIVFMSSCIAYVVRWRRSRSKAVA